MAGNSGINMSNGLVTSPGISASMFRGGGGLAQACGICFDDQAHRFLQHFIVFSALSSAVPQLTHLSWEA